MELCSRILDNEKVMTNAILRKLVFPGIATVKFTVGEETFFF